LNYKNLILEGVQFEWLNDKLTLTMFTDAPRTPLRRGSQRFLAENRPFISSTSSTGSGRDVGSGASGLSELEDAFQGIADEMEIFVRNVEEMDKITDILEETAESMAIFIQAQRMNTFCVEFPQVSIITFVLF
jgi:DASH complex subunit DAM1